MKVVKLRGVHIDSVLSLNTQVSRTVSSCFYQLRRLKAVRRSLPIEAAKTVVSSFVTSRVDYCNGLMAEITQQQVNAGCPQCGCLSSLRTDKARSHYTFDTRSVTLVAIHSTCNIQAVPSCL